jgi:phenylacetyl-CoA:acceptor oxidoreductase subunit 2
LLLLADTALGWPPLPAWFAALLVLLPLARIVGWWAYRRGVRRAGAPRGALAALDRFHGPLLAADLAAAVLAALSVASLAGIGPQVVAAGLALVAGWMLKLTIIRRAAFNQGFALVFAPERGVGGSGPPARPGW